MRTFWKKGLIVLLPATLLSIAENGGSGALFAQTKDISKAASLSGQLLDATDLTPIKDGKVFLTEVTTHFMKSVSSDEQGVYHFTGLDPGIYSISGNAGGHVDESMPTHLVVRAGSDLRGIDFRLPRPGAVSGRVHDASGLPLSYVTVELLTHKEHEVSRSLGTEKNGEFRISSLPPGRYYLRALPNSARTDADGMPTDTPPVYFPQAQRIEDAGIIEVVPDKEISGIDLTMKSPPTYSISGRVLDGVTGKPVSQGGLNATHYIHLSEFGQDAKIAADGSFRLEGMPAGHYHLKFLGFTDPSHSATFFPSTEFDLADQDMSGVVLILKPGVVLHGHVTATQPLPPHVSLLLTKHGKPRTTGIVHLQADGSFESPYIYPGDYDFRVDSNTWHIREMRLGDKLVDTKAEGILVKDAAPLPEVNIMLDSEVSTVSGIVMDGSGAPQPGVSVVLMSQASKRSPDSRLRSGTTGLDGRYRIANVIPGDYWLLAWPRTTVWDLLNPHLFARIENEAVAIQVGASPVVRDLKLTSKIKAAADNM